MVARWRTGGFYLAQSTDLPASSQVGFLLNFSLVPETKDHRLKGANWASPDVQQLRAIMRWMVEHIVV